LAKFTGESLAAEERTPRLAKADVWFCLLTRLSQALSFRRAKERW